MRPGQIEVVPRINTRLLADARRRVFYHIGKSFELSYMIKTLRGMHTMCRGKLLRSRTLARKVYKSLMGEGYRELKWTCPLYLRTD